MLNQAYTARLQFTPPRAPVGATVEVRGSGYPPDSPVELVWYTVDGRYEVEGGSEFIGQRTEPLAGLLSTIQSDRSGNISTQIEVPLDYGGPHDVRGRVNGEELSQASLTIEPTFSITPEEGPVGTPIELCIVGVDWRPNINTWHVLYDNHYFGFMSAVTSEGVATARIRAAGPVGERRISIWHNSFNSIPYLNWRQGPFGDVPSAEFAFRVTRDDGAPEPEVEDFSEVDAPWPVKVTRPASLTLEPDRGPVGRPATLRGDNFPAATALSIRLSSMAGNRVSGLGFYEVARTIGEVVTGLDGAFAHELRIPDDLGGQHRIDLADGDHVFASVGLVIQPTIVSCEPRRLRAGEQVAIHLKGLGWTTYENTYAVTYDNSYIGYACGFATNGDVEFNVTATGGPGTHLIDLYPTVYVGKEAVPKIYSLPQLTYADDHPVRITPAIRLAIEIVE